MESKNLIHIKKIVIASLVVILFIVNTVPVYASSNSKKSFLDNIKNSIEKLDIYDFSKKEAELARSEQLDKVAKELGQLKTKPNLRVQDITNVLNELPDGTDKNVLMNVVKMFDKDKDKDQASKPKFEFNLSALLDKLMQLIMQLRGWKPLELTDGTHQTIEMESKTADEFIRKTNSDKLDKYHVKLKAEVYKHNNPTDKWVVAIHPFTQSGTIMAGAVGKIYYEAGYNVLAPNLRMHGGSQGNVTLGFLESLDVYDWINKLNSENEVSQIIVHGISLGGATTNFLSGVDEMAKPAINDLKPLERLNVIGLVEDCGYVDMSQFADKKQLVNTIGVGLTEENFEHYSIADRGIKTCDLPYMIIHGTKDEMVDYTKNAKHIYEDLLSDKMYKGQKLAIKYDIVDGEHADIIMSDKHVEEYREKISGKGGFIEFAEKIASQRKLDEGSTENSNQKVENKDESFLDFIHRICPWLKK